MSNITIRPMKCRNYIIILSIDQFRFPICQCESRCLFVSGIHAGFCFKFLIRFAAFRTGSLRGLSTIIATSHKAKKHKKH